MRIGIYIRVSTDEQAKEGFSIETQRRIDNAFAIVKGADEVVEYIDDGYSAKNLRRPAVQRMIEDCKKRKLDAVLVWKLDRLTRDLRDMLMLMDDVFRKYSIEFISATESIDTTTPAGRLFLSILGAFAQNEREVNALRVKTVMTEISKGCKHMGGVPPYGYIVNTQGFYEIEPKEAEAVRMIFEMRGDGRSYTDISEALNKAGHKSRNGKGFGKNSLYDMLRNEKYTGVYIYNRAAEADPDGKRNNRASKPEEDIIRIEGGMPAIISIEQWKKVRSMTREGQSVGGKNHAKNIYVLSGLVYCGECGRKMSIANAGRNRDGSYWRAYRCPDKCVPGVEYRKLEDCVFEFIENLARDKDLVEKTIKTIEEFNTYTAEDANEDLGKMRAEIKEAQRQRDNLFKLASKSDDPPVSLMEEIKRREGEIGNLRRQISIKEASVLRISIADVRTRFELLANIRDLSKEEQKKVVNEVIEAVTIYGDRIDISITTRSDGSLRTF